MKTCVLIPSYNEAKTIGSLVKRIKNKGLDVVVVDDGSIDKTAEIARGSGAYVLKHKQNKGKGASLKDGFHFIINKDYDAVITMDGDDQHSPEDIPKFIKASDDPNVDMLVGNRMSSNKDMPFIRWMTNNLMSFLISIICKKNISDSQCGFRLIKRKVFKELSFFSPNFEIESEILIEAYRKGFTVKFIPIQTIYARQVSQIHPVIDTIRFFRFLLRICCPFLFHKKDEGGLLHFKKKDG